jgi:hypothetical protein
MWSQTSTTSESHTPTLSQHCALLNPQCNHCVNTMGDVLRSMGVAADADVCLEGTWCRSVDGEGVSWECCHAGWCVVYVQGVGAGRRVCFRLLFGSRGWCCTVNAVSVTCKRHPFIRLVLRMCWRLCCCPPGSRAPPTWTTSLRHCCTGTWRCTQNARHSSRHKPGTSQAVWMKVGHAQLQPPAAQEPAAGCSRKQLRAAAAVATMYRKQQQHVAGMVWRVRSVDVVATVGQFQLQSSAHSKLTAASMLSLDGCHVCSSCSRCPDRTSRPC